MRRRILSNSVVPDRTPGRRDVLPTAYCVWETAWRAVLHPCVWVVLLLSLTPAAQAQAQPTPFVYRNAPLPQVIAEVEAATPYRFLYRDALVAGATVTLDAASDDAVLPALDAALRAQGLALQVDTARAQVLITEVPQEAMVLLQGTVVDARDGTRLPMATVVWHDDGRLRGTATNDAGAFQADLRALAARHDTVTLRVSYVGYRPRRVAIDLQRLPPRLDVRLQPEAAWGREVVVTGNNLWHTTLDTTWQRLLQPSLFSPYGERSLIRALQPLPSVALTTAFSDGLHVRGTKADGFRVLLDGIPIYNQQHFFGLFDAFNDDALQTAGLFYDVAPASYMAPPGGTLALTTRTGSQTRLRTSVGLSNVAARGTLEGPVAKGRGSWLVSGRHATLNAFGWLGNDALIARGLGVDRPASPLPDPEAQEIGERIVQPGEAAAAFYDVHGKLYLEGRRGSRLMLSGYAGGNDTHQDAERFVWISTGEGLDDGFFRLRTVGTATRWGNEAASLQLQHGLSPRAYARTVAAVSHYRSAYAKDDFSYLNLDAAISLSALDPRAVRIAPFRYDNTLTEWKVAQDLDFALPAGVVSVGYAWHHYTVAYAETSELLIDRRFLTRTFDETKRAWQLDLFGHLDVAWPGLTLRAGLRTHYFAPDERVRLSPRLHVRLAPQRPLSVGVGLSRNYQFLHRLSLQNTQSANVWILSTAAQPPGAVDHATAGLYGRIGDHTAVQVEGYAKWHTRVRQHETDAPAFLIRRTSEVSKPWFHDLTSFARGLEVLLRQDAGPLRWTTSYALSRVELRPPDALDASSTAWYRADWDRLHQLTSHLHLRAGPHWSADLVWSYGSGTPNTLAYLPGAARFDEPADLSPYHRLDVSLSYGAAIGIARLDARVSLFNVYDRANAWYREPVLYLAPRRLSDRYRRGAAVVDVYDLGMQPAFDATLSF